MFDGLYQNYQKPLTRKGLLSNEGHSLEEVYKLDQFDDETFGDSYLQELNKLLRIEDVTYLIERLFALFAILKKFQDKYPGAGVPTLDHFYSELSPLLLQRFWEIGQEELSEEATKDLFRDSIFIALEEEIYNWQEKTNI